MKIHTSPFTHVLQTVQFWLRSITIKGHFAKMTLYIFEGIVACNRGNFLKIHVTLHLCPKNGPSVIAMDH
jgi:hypothetical protein